MNMQSVVVGCCCFFGGGADAIIKEGDNLWLGVNTSDAGI